ncbi:MAG: peptide MFS transporter [Alphaproteobacteria bacterium]
MSNSSSLLNHPRGLFVLSFSEMFERFSFYGMRSLLVLYMVNQLKYSDNVAYGIFGLYAALVYAAPLIGGFLADKVIGFRRAVITGSIIISLGHFCMALPIGDAALYIGVGLIISGTGLFKSNISAMVGMLYSADDQRRDAGYTLFYLGINIGGFLAPFACGYIATQYGWHLGFGLASVGMIIGALTLIFMTRHYAHIESEKPKGKALSTATLVGGLLAGPMFAGMVYYNDLFSNILPLFGFAFLGYIIYVAMNSNAAERRNIFVLVTAILLLMLSGALVEQSGMALTLFAERSVDRTIFGWVIPTSFFQSIDPLTVLLFAGPISAVWMRLAAKGRDLSAFAKYIIGFVLIGLAYLTVYLGCQAGDANQGLSPLFYAVSGMTLLALGDICLYPVCLSLCSRLAPKRLEGIMMGGVMMGLAFSNLMGAVLAKFASVSEEQLESVKVAETLGVYKSLFYDLTVIAAICIGISIIVKLIMLRVSNQATTA